MKCLKRTQIFLLFLVAGYEDDKVQLPFTVTDLKGQNLELVTGPYNGQVCSKCVQQQQQSNVYMFYTVLFFTKTSVKIIRSVFEFLICLIQSVCVEQLTLDFEYLINEVIRSDAAWASQFCSFSDYDVVILEVNNRRVIITRNESK